MNMAIPPPQNLSSVAAGVNWPLVEKTQISMKRKFFNRKGAYMKALLVLNKSQSDDFKVLISLNKKRLVEKVNELLLEEKIKEVFELFQSKGEVAGYYPAGTKPPEAPILTILEDML